MNEFISFNKMITPAIIRIIFWLGVAASVLLALVMIIGGAASPYGGGAMVIGGLTLLVLGPLSVRIYCELLIVMFKIHETLNTISAKIKKNPV